jgi:hypothetical protein
MLIAGCGSSSDNALFFGATATPLADNMIWEPVTGPHPFSADEAGKTLCSANELVKEEEFSGNWLLINTLNCSGITVQQPLAVDVKAGDLIELRVWHYPLRVGDEAFQLGLAVGDDVLLSFQEPVPHSANLIAHSLTVEKELIKGSPMTFHLLNQGVNEWALVTITARRPVESCALSPESCAAQVHCADWGECSFQECACVAATDDDCADAWVCKSYGRCTAESGRCIAGKDSDCVQSGHCLQDGWCTAKNGGCVGTSAADCQKSEVCAYIGFCSPDGIVACWAGDDSDCEDADICTHNGQCHAAQGQCWAQSNAECAASEACADEALCNEEGGRCVP